jgi:hypothetical protein
MRIEHENVVYETTITKPINKGDLYFDCMINKVKECHSFICFDPWSLKMEKVEERENN